jgi:hypothetical protein
MGNLPGTRKAKTPIIFFILGGAKRLTGPFKTA